MKAYVIKSWSTNDELYGTKLVPGQLVEKDGKYYFKRDSDELNLSMNPPDGHITWNTNTGPYELAVLSAKGLVYSPMYNGPLVPYLVAVITE